MNYIKLLPASAWLAVFISSALINGCNAREGQPNSSSATAPAIAQDPREASILTDLVQLTHDFDRAGEAYFSPDMKWIVFQASPHGQTHFGMPSATTARMMCASLTRQGRIFCPSFRPMENI